MKKLDDDELAKLDIVSRPEVTPGAADEAAKKPGKKAVAEAAAPPAPEESERAERQSRIFARRIERYLKGLTGDKVTPDEAAEIAEVGGMIFRGLLRVPMGGVIGGAIVALCIAIPFMPRLFKITAKKPEEKTQ